VNRNEVKRFEVALEHDQDLQAAVAESTGELEEVVSLAKDKGYNFTLDELRTYVETGMDVLSEQDPFFALPLYENPS
jgi:predicted ribosomally synthesized peptide with nif11-like leader